MLGLLFNLLVNCSVFERGTVVGVPNNALFCVKNGIYSFNLASIDPGVFRLPSGDWIETNRMPLFKETPNNNLTNVLCAGMATKTYLTLKAGKHVFYNERRIKLGLDLKVQLVSTMFRGTVDRNGVVVYGEPAKCLVVSENVVPVDSNPIKVLSTDFVVADLEGMNVFADNSFWLAIYNKKQPEWVCTNPKLATFTHIEQPL